MSKVPHAGRSKPEPSKAPYLAGTTKLVIAGGVATLLVAGTGLFWILKGNSEAGSEGFAVSTVRPAEVIRYAPPPETKAKSAPVETPHVQPPQGTVRRMEAISGSFSKK
jgi:hypothetical protein